MHLRKLLVALSLGVCAGWGQAADPIHQELLDKHKPEKISGHVWMIQGPIGYPNPQNQGFMNNPGFIVTADSVVVIDPGSSAAIGRAVVQHIKANTDKPVTHVLTTHVHGDHWLANQSIRDAWPDAKFYAHPAMIKLATEGAAEFWLGNMDTLTEGATKGTQALIPTEALSNGQVLGVGGVNIKVHIAEGKVHSSTDAMFEVLEDKVLFTGDNFNNRRIVRMDDGSFAGSIRVADVALKLDIETIVPGHGPKGGKQVLNYYRNYLDTVYGSVKTLRESMETFEMKPKIAEKLGDFKDWQGLDDELGKHISLGVLEAEQEDF